MKRKINSNYPSNSSNYERKELDVNLSFVLAIALGITIIIYGLLLPVRNSPLGILLYDRGFTQYLVICLAGIVVALTLLKFFKLQREFGSLSRTWIPEHISLENHTSGQVATLQQTLANYSNLIAVRCSRVLAAYIHSGNRKAATELALDDSSFYISASESSYAFPRIIVWAIPLLGFIGTVIGISSAVTGFSSFLEKTGEIDQIKEGIGTVTSGLAIAFDTTLLALFLSVLVMIPLVLVERFESRLLLAIDIYINDKLLPRLRDTTENLDESTINKAVNQALKEHLPNPEELIEPAHDYAKQAATNLAEGFVTEVGKVQVMSAKLFQQMSKVNKMALQDRQEFITSFEDQQQTSKDIVSEIRAIVNEIKAGNVAISTGLAVQAEQISNQLDQAAKALESRIAALEKSTARISEITKLQQSLDQIQHSLEQAAKLEQILVGLGENLGQLQSVLQQLGKPRRITFVEQLEQDDRSL